MYRNIYKYRIQYQNGEMTSEGSGLWFSLHTLQTFVLLWFLMFIILYLYRSSISGS